MGKIKKLAICLLLGIIIFCSDIAYGAVYLDISAEAAIVIDAESGEIICQRDAFTARPPASLTKVMTAILAIELAEEEKICTVSANAAKTGESHIGFYAGEKITLENLLYGALLKSGNDACVAIAENIGENEAHYVQLMNLKAKLLGCRNTNFVNTNGLPAQNHYSTCYDLALMSRYAISNDMFRQIVSTESYTMTWLSSTRSKNISNTNHLLNSYDGAIGVKTGTTDEAGQCLIAAAERDGKSYIAVVLKSKNRFADGIKLLDYAFSLEDI